MDKEEKKEKKKIISEFINLSSGRFKDYEIDTLLDLVENRHKYNGRSKTYSDKFTDWCSDGKYTRWEDTTYTFNADDNRICIEVVYEYHDDDGQTGGTQTSFGTARAILNVLPYLQLH